MTRRLVVVSNRVANPKGVTSGSQGGLAVAMLAALQERGGTWFGWSGRVADSEVEGPRIHRHHKVTFATVDLTQEDYEEYYNGYANRTLWPLFHYRVDLADFSRRNVSGYLRVNERFADWLRPLLEPDDIVWVHDYHLIPLGRRLRKAGCRQRLGFFLHIPWPAFQVLLALPNHREIVEALAAYDLVGFQTADDLFAFQQYVIREAGGRIRRDGSIRAFGRTFRADAFPIAIDTEHVASAAARSEGSRQVNRLIASLRGRSLIIGVDRLDYSKGLLVRMEAIERLLDAHPEHRGHVTVLQIAPPSRTDVPEYAEIRHALEAQAGHVNGRYAEFDWVPIRYLNRGYSRNVLTGFYRSSRVGLVTPLRDGMNLVAKEYVASQRPNDPGVLVLSRFAGAARELDGAIIVNPYDAENIGEALNEALHMPRQERRARWSAMYEYLRQHDVESWQRRFLDTLVATEAVT